MLVLRVVCYDLGTTVLCYKSSLRYLRERPPAQLTLLPWAFVYYRYRSGSVSHRFSLEGDYAQRRHQWRTATPDPDPEMMRRNQTMFLLIVGIDSSLWGFVWRLDPSFVARHAAATQKWRFFICSHHALHACAPFMSMFPANASAFSQVTDRRVYRIE